MSVKIFYHVELFFLVGQLKQAFQFGGPWMGKSYLKKTPQVWALQRLYTENNSMVTVARHFVRQTFKGHFLMKNSSNVTVPVNI